MTVAYKGIDFGANTNCGPYGKSYNSFCSEDPNSPKCPLSIQWDNCKGKIATRSVIWGNDKATSIPIDEKAIRMGGCKYQYFAVYTCSEEGVQLLSCILMLSFLLKNKVSDFISKLMVSMSIIGSSGLKNSGKDCWYVCNNTQGNCAYCGTGVCCRKGWWDKSNGCDGSIGGNGYHTCVEQGNILDHNSLKVL